MDMHKYAELQDAIKGQRQEDIKNILGNASPDELFEMEKAVWNEPSEYMSEEAVLEEYDMFRQRIGKIRKRHVVRYAVASVAAACAVFAIGLAAGLLKGAPETEILVAQWDEACTDYNQTEKIILEDSTVVWLNSGSRLLYPQQFIGGDRTVYLSGEAMFEVSKDTAKPFIVKSGNSSIKVTGTKFNVKSYIDDDIQIITLMEGGVDIYMKEMDTIFRLKPGNAISYNKSTNDLNMYAVSEDEFPAWYKGEFDAYHMPLGLIAKDLERKFNVDIIFRNPELSNIMFYASFVNAESVDKILTSLNYDNSLTIERTGNTIYIGD